MNHLNEQPVNRGDSRVAADDEPGGSDAGVARDPLHADDHTFGWPAELPSLINEREDEFANRALICGIWRRPGHP